MTAYKAAWVLPIDQPPIRDAVIEIESGVIKSLNPGSFAFAPSALRRDRLVKDLGNVAILPGLINAHTHLELSWLRGRVPPANTFTDWVKALVSIRRGTEHLITPEIVAPVHAAIAELRASGTVAVGDITNSLAAVAPMKETGLRGVVFHELLGFKERDGALIEATREKRGAAASHGIPISLAPHAPYSTSVELFKAIRQAVSSSNCPIMSVHLGESAEEVELLEKGSGPWRGMLETIGVWRDDWEIPACGPVQFLERHGVLDSRTLVVHGVQLDDRSLQRLKALDATIVTCPRSNRWVGVGYPPIERFYKSGVAVAVGTDSLASVEDLNLFSELKTMRWLAPDVQARTLLESATIVGAKALGLERDLGSITPGKHAELIAVTLPGTATDVEEYLVSGIEPSQITWVK
ncbi:MAG TPA: amidohydrolase family protein [Vicinamibacterales bacterium]|nr:amidohydrolase family protein [Vicinamibacterales bacterium]